MLRAEIPQHGVRLILVRHGEVEERYHRVFGGCRIDMGLSSLGLEHGESAGGANDWAVFAAVGVGGGGDG
jgi:broad specificity phosphatase PhoE